MQNIKDKKFGASAKSFINMGSATLAVFIMNARSRYPEMHS